MKIEKMTLVELLMLQDAIDEQLKKMKYRGCIYNPYMI